MPFRTLLTLLVLVIAAAAGTLWAAHALPRVALGLIGVAALALTLLIRRKA